MMDEATRQQILERWRGGASMRAVARQLHLSRKTVRRVIEQVQAQRSGGRNELPPKPRKRPSKLDAWQPIIEELLGRYPNITAARVHEELTARGFSGGYTIVREKVGVLRPSPRREPTMRFETDPGIQAQMDFATYTIDFTAEGRRRMHLFGYILGYSRRQYLRFVERQDFETTAREHIRAFEHLGGAAATCLYDNMKVVVIRWEDGEPIYNPRFLAFATHYGFKPWVCRPRRAQTKGKIERPFGYVESSLLGGRTFRCLEHLNEVARWWLENVSDVRIHRTTGERPIDRHAQERSYLTPLPARPYDPSPVVYRVVDAEGLVAWRNNRYSVPWRYIGRTLPLRITETELVAYSPDVEEIARHPLLGDQRSGEKSIQPQHLPRRDGAERLQLLRERYQELGEVAKCFLEGVSTSRRYGKDEARKVLALLGTYSRADWLRAVERAVRYRAFSRRAVERILAVTAHPKGPSEAFADDDVRRRLEPIDSGPAVPPRPTAEYQPLLDPEPSDESSSKPRDQPSDEEDGR